MPEALRQVNPPAALRRNTDCGVVLGYRYLAGYGVAFDNWASADGSAVAWCDGPLGFRMRNRMRLCLAGVVAQLRWEVRQ